LGGAKDYIICGDFNFDIGEDKLVEEEKNITTATRGAFIQLWFNEYSVDWKGWQQPISDPTLVNLRRDAIHDGFLIPPSWYPLTAYGVDKPDYDQHERIAAEGLCIIKESFIKKMLLASITDHWPIYIDCHL
jgi:hypothetical protein